VKKERKNNMMMDGHLVHHQHLDGVKMEDKLNDAG
jgi:hypothetical protein